MLVVPNLIVVVVQPLSRVQLFATLWTVACQATLSFTISQSLLKHIPIELVMPSNHFILCCNLLLLPSVFSRIKVFSNESALCIKWLGCHLIGASALALVLPMNIQCWFPRGLTGLISLQSKELSRVFSSTTTWKQYVWVPLKWSKTCAAPGHGSLSVSCFLFVVNRLQPPWPSLCPKGQIWAFANPQRERIERQRKRPHTWLKDPNKLIRRLPEARLKKCRSCTHHGPYQQSCPWSIAIKLLAKSPGVGTSFWGMSTLCPPLPGKAIKLLFSLSPKTLSEIHFGTGTQRLSFCHHFLLLNPGKIDIFTSLKFLVALWFTFGQWNESRNDEWHFWTDIFKCRCMILYVHLPHSGESWSLSLRGDHVLQKAHI